MATLESLPGEILYHIATKCPPSTYYNFALAYKRLYLVSRNYYKKLHIRIQYETDKVYECLLDGTAHGECKWYSGFNIIERSNFRKGILHGTFYSYHDDGKLKIECSYNNGMRHGRYILYYQNGNVHSISSYHMGKKYGHTLGYYPDGTIERRIKHTPIQKESYYNVNGVLYARYKFSPDDHTCARSLPSGKKMIINKSSHTYE